MSALFLASHGFMRSSGIDIASGGFSAAALAIDGIPTNAVLWKADKKDADPDRLVKFSRFLDFQWGLWKPDIIAVEELAVFMNKKVIRALARMEGVALRQAKLRGVIVVSPPVVTARSIVFKGQGVRQKRTLSGISRAISDFVASRQSGCADIVDAMTRAWRRSNSLNDGNNIAKDPRLISEHAPKQMSRWKHAIDSHGAGRPRGACRCQKYVNVCLVCKSERELASGAHTGTEA